MFLWRPRHRRRRVGKAAGLRPKRAGAFLRAALWALLVASGFVPRLAFGCPYSIRDVGFVDLGSPPYRLYFFVKDGAPDKNAIVSAFEEASVTSLTDSNVEAEVVNVDQQMAHPAKEFLRFWGLKTLPAAVLVSPSGRSLALPFDLSKPLREAIRGAAEKVVRSPIRDELAREIVRTWGIVLVVEGKDKAENVSAKKTIEEAISDVARMMSRSGETAAEKPEMLVVSRETLAEEEILLWSFGLGDAEFLGPQVAVLYGRGRQIGPVLGGESLNRDSLFHILSTIGMKCGCETDHRWLSGTLIPLRWGKELRTETVRYLGFDPDNPLVRAEVGGIWTEGRDSSQDDAGPFEYSEGEIVSWDRYASLAEEPAQTRQVASPVSEGKSISQFGTEVRSPSRLSRRMGRVIVVVVGVAVVILATVSAYVATRTRERNAAHGSTNSDT